ncbi:hypothetical protein BH20ACT2_BH20ACT2_06400 [soil metagenome]
MTGPPGPPPAGPLVHHEFTLDDFQLRAIAAIDAGRSVLVAAPTGSGKTVVAEHAVARALAERGRAFYTTPIKALSNQKYGDLVRRHGVEQVGLLTGDNAINAEAPVVVMTTEVLRNMIYSRSSHLDQLTYVVLDEVHYLQDAYRGPVWEEVIVHAPAAVKLICLSATVSNAGELAEWITTVRGPTTTVIETRRPIELRNLYLVGDRSQARLALLPVLVDGRANPEAQRLATEPARSPKHRRGRPRRRLYTPRRVEVIERLADDDLLPAITFIFSRAACDDAVAACLDAGLRLTTVAQRARIRALVDERTAALSDADLDVLGFDRWVAGLEAGLAAHHAGMVPPFKETVEACFAEGLVRAVFATETLALGINMPARTVVIEKLTKWGGDRHDFLTPAEYTQLTGRAGRRGIDALGHAVVLWSPFVAFEQVAALAASRSFTLTSAFRPTYNMAANLVRRYAPEEAHRLLNRSFAQYQADRSVVRLEQRLAERTERLVRLREQARRDDHARAAVKLERAERELADLGRRIDTSSGSLVRRFDDVLGLLESWGHLDGWALTGRGDTLARLYHECDLLLAEALHEGFLDGVDPPTLAGLVSCCTYEHRSKEPAPPPWFPSADVSDRVAALLGVADELRHDEEGARLPLTRRPDPTFFAVAHAWASGEALDRVLDDEDLSGGDFFRNIKQLIDLLRQLGEVAPVPATGRAARSAAEALFRGVVAASSVLTTADEDEPLGVVATGDAP